MGRSSTAGACALTPLIQTKVQPGRCFFLFCLKIRNAVVLSFPAINKLPGSFDYDKTGTQTGSQTGCSTDALLF